MDPTHPSHPEFWNERYLGGQTPWDFGGVPAALKAYLARRPKGGRVLIPGCGTGYEVKAFADAGYEVTAIDLASAAIDRARKLVGGAGTKNLFVGDFFTHDFGPTKFDVIYERSFICALIPTQREAYRNRVAALLRRHGLLIGYFFYQVPNIETGPPFGFAWGTADELFSRYFLLVKDTAVTDSLAVFQGRERWQERARTAYGAL